jgi:hypothetical protein
MSMEDNFRNYGEALDYCKKYDLESLCPQSSPFKIAEALLRAYKDGAIQPKDAADAKGRCSTCGGRKNENPWCSNSFHLQDRRR